MHSSKLVRALKTFSPTDWSALRKLAASPYHFPARDAPILLQLFEHIERTAPRFRPEDLSKVKIAAFLFPESSHPANSRLPKLMTKAMRLVETYLLQTQHDLGAEADRQILLAQAWEARGLSNLARQHLAKAERTLSNEAPAGTAFAQRRLRLSEAWFTHHSSGSFQEAAHHLRQSEQRLDEWYLLAKLETVVWQLAQRIQLNTEQPASLVKVDLLLPLVSSLDFDTFPIHGIYYYALHFLRVYDHADSELFSAVKQRLNTHGHLLETDKLKALQTLLRIFATGQYNIGQQAYLATSLELYQEHLQAGYLYFNDKIHSLTLLNMVTLGLRRGEFAWVDNLLTNHRERILDGESAPNTFRFNLALVAFYRGRLEEARSQLDDNYNNLYYRLAARRLEIMIYYQQGSTLFDAKVEAFKVYIFRLSRKQLPTKPKALNNNFIDILRQIAHPATLGNAKRRARISRRIAATKILAEREWLTRMASHV